VLEASERFTWAATVRAVAAAGAEVVSAHAAWGHRADAAAAGVQESLMKLLSYVEQLAALLEATEPDMPVGAADDDQPQGLPSY
jgi:hypothetical protein